MISSRKEDISTDYSEIIGPLSWKLKLAYGVGHVLNDICASMWFTYLLVYFHLVLNFDSFLSGVLLLVGQIADAIATPFIGLQADRDDNFWLCRYGRRKTWHLFGTVCVLGSFPFIFTPCISCEGSKHWAQLIYYSAFVVIFQIGWASIQISHLSLIPDLTPNEHERTSLTAIRYSFTVISTVLVYVITWIVLHMSGNGDKAQVSPADASKFQIVVLIGIALGAVMSLIFHIFVSEAQTQSVRNVQDPHQRKTAGRMLKEPRMYQVAAIYMATRLFANLTQVYTPLYLHEDLTMPAESLAIIPLVMYLASFVVSLMNKMLNKNLGRKAAYLIGSTLGLAGCLWIRFGSGVNYTTYEIYGVAILLGASSSVILVTSLGITADLIGPNTESGAFVYGAMSFTDKLSNGLAVFIIQDLKCVNACPNYYRDMLTFVCGGAAFFGSVFVLLLRNQHHYTFKDHEDLIEDRICHDSAIEELRDNEDASTS